MLCDCDLVVQFFKLAFTEFCFLLSTEGKTLAKLLYINSAVAFAVINIAMLSYKWQTLKHNNVMMKSTY